jgi:DNA-binding transcriptional LysR family regulator
MYCSEEHPLYDKPSINIQDISKYDYAGYSFMDDYDRFRSDGSLVKTASVDSMEAVATLISTGCFLGTLPDHYVESLWRLKNFRNILPDVFGFSTDIELITRHGTSSPHVMALLDHLDVLQPEISSERRSRGDAKLLSKVACETGVL